MPLILPSRYIRDIEKRELSEYYSDYPLDIRHINYNMFLDASAFENYVAISSFFRKKERNG